MYHTTTKQQDIMTTFEAGKTYEIKLNDDSNNVVAITIIKRTAKTVKFELEGEIVTKRIKSDEQSECILPFGNYSQCLFCWAKNEVKEPTITTGNENELTAEVKKTRFNSDTYEENEKALTAILYNHTCEKEMKISEADYEEVVKDIMKYTLF